MDKPRGTADAEKFKGRFTLTVGKLNELLDELVVAGGGRGAPMQQREAEAGAVVGKKATVLRSVMQATTPKQMRWIVLIILGNLKASSWTKLSCIFV